MVSMFSFSVPLDKKDTIHTAQQVSSVALFVHGCDIAGNLAAPGHRAVNACSAPLSALAAEKNSRVHGSCTYSATLTAPRAVAMPTAPAVPVASKMHAAPCLEPRSVAAPTSSLSTPSMHVVRSSERVTPACMHWCGAAAAASNARRYSVATCSRRLAPLASPCMRTTHLFSSGPARSSAASSQSDPLRPKLVPTAQRPLLPFLINLIRKGNCFTSLGQIGVQISISRQSSSEPLEGDTCRYR